MAVVVDGAARAASHLNRQPGLPPSPSALALADCTVQRSRDSQTHLPAASPQFACPLDPRTGGPKDRVIKINIECDVTYPDAPLLESAVESDM